MPGGETDGANTHLSSLSSNLGRTLVTLDFGYLEPFDPKGEPHRLSQW